MKDIFPTALEQIDEVAKPKIGFKGKTNDVSISRKVKPILK